MTSIWIILAVSVDLTWQDKGKKEELGITLASINILGTLPFDSSVMFL